MSFPVSYFASKALHAWYIYKGVRLPYLWRSNNTLIGTVTVLLLVKFVVNSPQTYGYRTSKGPATVLAF